MGGERVWLVRVAAALAVAAFVFGIPTAQPAEKAEKPAAPSPAAKKAAAPAASVESPDWPVIRLLARHFGIEVDTEPPRGRELVLDDLHKALHANGAEPKFALASVPDPIDSHLAYMFDEHVDALTRAATELHYSLESWTFPWARDGEASKSAVQDLGGPARHRRVPGAMLFSRDAPETEAGGVLVVLLVGEAPTFGVHPSALYHSLVLAGRLARLANAKEVALSFVGPTYSGSARPLAGWLERWSPKLCASHAWQIDFFTGSATNPLIAKDLAKTHLAGKKPCLTSTFQRLTHDDSELSRQFHEYLAFRRDPDVEYAEVSERGTVYGSTDTDPKNGPQFELKFPLHLSQLRSASERSQSSDAPWGKLDSPLVRNALDLAMDEEAAAVDVPPPYSPRLSANVMELQLANTLASIHQRRIRYVGLTATDTRDKLFLAKLLRRVAPSAHLFSLDSDVLYSHPRFSQDLLGTLVVSSYPLTSKLPEPLQAWTGRSTAKGSDRPPTTFGSGATEGAHAAAVAAFGWSKTDCAPETRPCAWLGPEEERPPVWVSAVGRDTTWPVWVSGWPKKRGAAVEEEWAAISSKIVPSLFYRVTLVFLALFAAVQGVTHLAGAGVFGAAARAWLASASPPPSVLRWLLVPDLPSQASRRLAVTRAMYLAISLALTAVPTGLALIPLLGSLDVGTAIASLRLPELLAAACVALAIAPAATCALWCFVRTHPSPWTARAAALAGVVAALLVGFHWLPAELASGDLASRINWLLFSQRATRIESGLTPLAPIVLLGGGLVAMIVVLARRAQLGGRFEAINPLRSVAESALGSRIAPYAEAIHQELRPLGQVRHPTPVGVGAFIVLVAAPAIPFLSEAWFPLDTSAWAVSFKAAAVALVAALVYSSLGFLAVWARTRKLLRALSTSHLRDAFGRLPTRMNRSIGLEPSAAPAIVSELEYCLRQRRLLSVYLDDLLRAPTSFPAQYLVEWARTTRDGNRESSHRTRVTGLETVLARDLSAAAKSHRRVPAILTSSQTELSREASEFVLPVLEKWWAEGEQPLVRAAQLIEAAKLGGDLKPLPSARPFDAVTLADNGFSTLDQRFWFRLAEEFVASQVVSFLSYVFVHLRSSLRGTTSGLVLLLLAVSSYPFEPQLVTLNFVTMLVAAAVVAALVTFTQASRNELLSLIENTPPNEVSWNGNLVLQVATYVAIPVAAALTSQLPLLGRVVSTVFSGLTAR